MRITNARKFFACSRKLYTVSSMTNVFDNRAPPTDGLDESPALPLVSVETLIHQDGKPINVKIFNRRNSFLFLAFVPTVFRSDGKPKTVSSAEVYPLALPTRRNTSCVYDEANLERASCLLRYSWKHAWRHRYFQNKTRRKLRATITHPNRLEASRYMPWPLKTSYLYETISPATRTDTFVSTERRLMHLSLVWYCSAPCC